MTTNKYSLETLSVLVEHSDKKISDMNEKFINLEEKIDNKFDTVSEKFDAVSDKFDIFADKMDKQNEKLDKILCGFNTRIAENETKTAVIIEKTSKQEDSISRIREQSNKNNLELTTFKKALVMIVSAIGVVGTIVGIIVNFY